MQKPRYVKMELEMAAIFDSNMAASLVWNMSNTKDL